MLDRVGLAADAGKPGGPRGAASELTKLSSGGHAEKARTPKTAGSHKVTRTPVRHATVDLTDARNELDAELVGLVAAAVFDRTRRG